ncbi:ankyrin repeat domain-containing protein [Priestia koreensis]|uniref:Uncharacterized protein n=1 Tax=Priestia koreensis TaxID=284581 RepID=A0A0M0KUV9_9BACI|nr:ankyrin repeat domain-containing protein [Priestia koreensis]KOO42601.1 hypothetical protein AMD01_18240 [Priestia koreensis]
MNIQEAIKDNRVNDVIHYIQDHEKELINGDRRIDPLHLALKFNCHSLIQYLFNIDYHLKCNETKQRTFLKDAAHYNHLEPLIKLVKDVPYSKDTLTYSLRDVASKSDIYCVRILLDAGAEFSTNNFSALVSAIQCENRDVSLFLAGELKDLQVRGWRGFSLLHYAAECSRDELILQYLLYRELDVNLPNEDGQTPLMLSLFSIELDAENQFFEFAVELLKAGADPNIQDKSGHTVLMSACWFEGYASYGDNYIIEYMEMLILNGADIKLKNNKSQTALDIAKEYQFDKAIELLEKYHNQSIKIPDMNVDENNNSAVSTSNFPLTSFLSEQGYTTKVSRKKRWNILVGDILPKHQPQEVVDKLASFVKRFKAQRNGSVKYANAIEEWEYDINRLKSYFSK